MDSDSLYYSLELVAGSGYTLNVEQRTALQTSLVILKKNYKFHRVLFWGKILGLKEDYFIAQGRGENEMQDKKNLYSFNCMDWFLLPPVTDSMIEEVAKATKGRFIGDPTYVYDNVEIRRQGKRDGPIEEEVVTKVNEESRLAVTVHQIDEEVSVVPRGAIVKRPHGLVQINRSFGGLSHSEAGKLDNFLHFSKPKNLKKKSIVEMGDFNPAIDFLDVLSDDIPKASWSLQFECASKVCVLRSLLWLGLTFYHVPLTPQHGHIYIGDGTKNLDLPFML
ncbi:radial spoke head protein 9 homolog isoform X1 [Micropterus dolomieu]|uniref:radial spoke head protein 9 homolog isoform X1 n=1 Tax=Micropterus dolomieu TaxID=147949 RepID=UPI001E8E05FB|nr:radial spoke head protein 9 homolog isoform X1 [Micropterus dolomieu]